MLERWCQPAQAGDPKETLYIRLAGIDAPEIGMVWVNPAWWPVLPTRNVSIEMLRRGLAVMYRATGAQYGGNPTQFNRVEQTAK
ncbi:hypothetical protein BATDEDRAFT_88245 [Batrachochytrium dendrobatidis JAM81]|uniref:Uncharacterized protein n=2 Tax=Batrachochytrium dendrobatidis TaxID=109871 RepID=F4P1I5_BATDJ|nr:uncharacterized protein BATDEDRAFT_88245 [Batrachochytrium dendrobatidis JAM81]EGF80911.1 hypothetical protein BATDEDRAFT_88245 [Batrachochytrium dendrobatidis JAM81]OAJ41622.1 hypothetical protein BDEG_25190 [Batrachochytrium dendrobatidis JEL423]|eukprot:XP_006678744.1 hypothetical protein BATDEDRAFT_88245 [Batrachochytrium dendrobatidis JAM81]